MIVWLSAEERAAQAEAAPMRISAQETKQVLTDARSWGFAHGVRFPYQLFDTGVPRADR